MYIVSLLDYCTSRQFVLITVSSCADCCRPWVQDCCVDYNVTLSNAAKCTIHVYLVVDDPRRVRVPAVVPAADCFEWEVVTRRMCSKGCVGPIQRDIYFSKWIKLSEVR